jgi:signal transduction histidine kinase
LGFWIVFASVCAVQSYLSQIVWDKPISWSLAFRRSFEEWSPWALLTFGALWMVRRFHLARMNLRQWVTAHLAGSVGAALFHAAMFACLLHGQTSIEGVVFKFPTMFKKLILYHLQIDMVIYWTIVLGHHGWHYYKSYLEREKQAAALATELVQARLDALRMQLNPHFLFNTLHAISALIQDNPRAADRMIARLSELLRHTLDQADAQEVPLRHELAFLEGYLEIERTRFQDRLSVQMAVEPEVEQVLVPPLILQPLVENAIRHGIEPREDPGRVEIRIQRRDGMLELKVTDNGPGLPENEAPASREGIGLSNTRSRLSHLYGANHRLELVSVPGGGLEVRLLIPCRTESSVCRPRVVIMSGEAAQDITCVDEPGRGQRRSC